MKMKKRVAGGSINGGIWRNGIANNGGGISENNGVAAMKMASMAKISERKRSESYQRKYQWRKWHGSMASA